MHHTTFTYRSIYNRTWDLKLNFFIPVGSIDLWPPQYAFLHLCLSWARAFQVDPFISASSLLIYINLGFVLPSTLFQQLKHLLCPGFGCNVLTPCIHLLGSFCLTLLFQTIVLRSQTDLVIRKDDFLLNSFDNCFYGASRFPGLVAEHQYWLSRSFVLKYISNR